MALEIDEHIDLKRQVDETCAIADFAVLRLQDFRATFEDMAGEIPLVHGGTLDL